MTLEFSLLCVMLLTITTVGPYSRSNTIHVSTSVIVAYAFSLVFVAISECGLFCIDIQQWKIPSMARTNSGTCEGVFYNFLSCNQRVMASIFVHRKDKCPVQMSLSDPECNIAVLLVYLVILPLLTSAAL